MSITVHIVTTANRRRSFVQHDETAIQHILDSLKRCSQLFTSRTLILASAGETEIFAPSSLTRIEIITTRDLAPYVPHFGDLAMRGLRPDEVTPPAHIDDEFFAGRIEFFFNGGDHVATWAEASRPPAASERLMRLTRLFEQPVLTYSLPEGGVGFMNPAAMTRAVLAAAADPLPSHIWQVNPS